jgi:hypothetical protein
MLRSGMMGWLTIMLDTTAWTPEQRKAAKMAFAVYKTNPRPLIRDADLYHVSDRSDGIHWDGLEYFDAKKGRGVLYAFRGSTQTESIHTLCQKASRQATFRTTLRRIKRFPEGTCCPAESLSNSPGL